jgi:hypothetical protein
MPSDRVKATQQRVLALVRQQFLPATLQPTNPVQLLEWLSDAQLLLLEQC